MTADVFTTATTPESVGIPSTAILRFLERIDAERIHMHGVLLVRRGQVAAEGYWAPWSAQRKHRMYSITKSFVSLAVGMMVDAGKLRLDDRVADHFADKVPETLHPWAAAQTVRDLLMMATPYASGSYTNDGPDWVRSYFHKTATHPPGCLFSYDTGATVVLTTLVEQLAGKPFLDVMRPGFLDRIGFSEDAWCIRTPTGGSWGGSGLLCTLRDLAKVALTCMHGGKWGDQQVLPADYVRAATARQIDNAIRGHHGYGYQIWREAGDGFAFRGMGSQYAAAFPERDFLFTCTADTQGAPAGSPILQVMHQELCPHLADGPLPEDPEAQAALRARIEALAVLPLPGSTASPAAAAVNGVWYAMDDNPMGITRTRLTFDGDRGTWEYTNEQGEKALSFGLGRTVQGSFPQRGYHGAQIGVPADTPYECLASAAWVDERTLNLEVLITDIHLGGLRVSFAFQGTTGDEVTVFMAQQAEWFLDEYQGSAGGRRSEA